MQLQKAISDFFKNNKYGSLVPFCGPQGPAHGRDTQVWMRRTLHGEPKPPGAHSPHVGPSSGQEAWVAAGAGELAGAGGLVLARDTPPEQPGSEGLGIA